MYRCVATMALGCALAFWGTISIAATWTGGGGDNNWTTAGNWGGAAPISPEALIFAGTTRLAPTNDFAALTQFNGITFDGTAGAFTLGGNSITLGGATATPTVINGVDNNSANLQTINLGLTLATGVHTFAGGGGGLALNPAGGLLRGPGAVATFDPEAGGISTTTISNTNGILGSWSRVGAGLTASWATVGVGNQIVGYTDYTPVAAGGAITSNPASNIDIAVAGGPVTMAALGTTDMNTLRYSANAAIQIVDIGAGNTLRLGTMGGILRTGTTNDNNTNITVGAAGDGSVLTAGGPTLNTPGELVLDTGTGSREQDTAMIIISAIADNGTGAVRLVKNGFASTILRGTNTYTGGTYITAGRLETEITPSALGTGDVTITGTGQLFIDSPATQPYTQNFFISGIGTGEAGGHGAMRLNSAPIDGTITLIGDARITRRGGTGTINGRITGGFNLELGGYDNDANSLIILTSVNNDWTGDTRISQASTVRLARAKSFHTAPARVICC